MKNYVSFGGGLVPLYIWCLKSYPIHRSFGASRTCRAEAHDLAAGAVYLAGLYEQYVPFLLEKKEKDLKKRFKKDMKEKI